MSRRRIAGLLLAAAVAVPLAACSSDDSASGSGVSIEHVYGTTVVPANPERIATVAWGNHEVPLALGVQPVAMVKATWGDDNDNGMLPWVEEKVDALGGEKPALLDETDGIDYEAIADTNPDVILASYSGLEKDQYDKLSKIAPVVAYPKLAWGTSWEDMTLMNAKAIGKEAEGRALVDSLHQQVSASLDRHADLKGRKVMFAYVDPTDMSKIGYYTTHDTRQGFLIDNGMQAPDAVVRGSEKSEKFYEEISAEEAGQFSDVDLIITYGDADLLGRMQANPLLSKIPAVAKGHVALLPDNSPIAAMANPGPLSIPWGMDRYFDVLSAGLQDK